MAPSEIIEEEEIEEIEKKQFPFLSDYSEGVADRAQHYKNLGQNAFWYVSPKIDIVAKVIFDLEMEEEEDKEEFIEITMAYLIEEGFKVRLLQNEEELEVAPLKLSSEVVFKDLDETNKEKEAYEYIVEWGVLVDDIFIAINEEIMVENDMSIVGNDLIIKTSTSYGGVENKRRRN